VGVTHFGEALPLPPGTPQLIAGDIPAVNLEVTATHRARIGLHVTAEHRDGRFLLAARGRTLFEQTISLNPGKPFLAEITLPDAAAEKDLKVSLFDGAEDRALCSVRQLRQGARVAP